MSDPLVYEVPGKVYLDRANRTRRILEELKAGATVDVVDWAERMGAVQREVDEIPLVVGVTYRIVLLGGRASATHVHLVDDAGELHGIDLPSLEGREMLTIEGVFRGRRPAPPFPGAVRPILIDCAGDLAMLTDSDVLRLEEIR